MRRFFARPVTTTYGKNHFFSAIIPHPHFSSKNYKLAIKEALNIYVNMDINDKQEFIDMMTKRKEWFDSHVSSGIDPADVLKKMNALISLRNIEKKQRNISTKIKPISSLSIEFRKLILLNELRLCYLNTPPELHLNQFHDQLRTTTETAILAAKNESDLKKAYAEFCEYYRIYKAHEKEESSLFGPRTFADSIAYFSTLLENFANMPTATYTHDWQLMMSYAMAHETVSHYINQAQQKGICIVSSSDVLFPRLIHADYKIYAALRWELRNRIKPVITENDTVQFKMMINAGETWLLNEIAAGNTPFDAFHKMQALICLRNFGNSNNQSDISVAPDALLRL